MESLIPCLQLVYVMHAAHQPFQCRIRRKYLDDRKNFFCSLTEAAASDNLFWDRKRNSGEIMGILSQIVFRKLL